MARRKTFWTPKRLIELRVVSRTMNPDELISHFGRSWPDIQQAQLFEANRRRLKQAPRTEVINGKTVVVTCFAAEYAAGARTPIVCHHP